MHLVDSSVSSHTLLSLAGAAYEAALEPERWRHFLEQFGAALRSPACLIWAHDFQSGTADLEGRYESLGLNMGFDEGALASFNAHYHRTNVWLQNPELHQAGTVVHSSHLFDDSKLTRTEWYADWLQPLNLFYSCAAVVEHQADRSFNVTALRSKALGAYTAAELKLVEGLIPHLKTAFALHRKLHRSQTLAHSSVAVLDSVPIGVVLLNAQGQLVHANARAHHLMQDSGLLHIHAQRIQASLLADQTWLEQTVGQCARMTQAMAHASTRHVRADSCSESASVHSGEARRMQHWSGKQLHVMVAPMPLTTQPYGVQCGVVVMLSDPGRIFTSLVNVLQQYYRMTRAEAKLVQALINGQSPQEYADQVGLSINTVRTQFKAAAAKVGVSRQADLVRVVLMGPAMLRWEQAQAVS